MDTRTDTQNYRSRISSASPSKGASAAPLRPAGSRTSRGWWKPRCRRRSPASRWWSSTLGPSACRARAWPGPAPPSYTCARREKTIFIPALASGGRPSAKLRACKGRRGHSWTGRWWRLRLLPGWTERPRVRPSPWPGRRRLRARSASGCKLSPETRAGASRAHTLLLHQASGGGSSPAQMLA